MATSDFIFNPLEYADELEAAGMSRTIAEAEAKALFRVLTVNFKELATKQDLFVTKESLRHEMHHEIGGLHKDMNAKLTGVKFELLAWMIGIVIAQTGLLVALKR